MRREKSPIESVNPGKYGRRGPNERESRASVQRKSCAIGTCCNNGAGSVLCQEAGKRCRAPERVAWSTRGLQQNERRGPWRGCVGVYFLVVEPEGCRFDRVLGLPAGTNKQRERLHHFLCRLQINKLCIPLSHAYVLIKYKMQEFAPCTKDNSTPISLLARKQNWICQQNCL